MQGLSLPARPASGGQGQALPLQKSPMNVRIPTFMEAYNFFLDRNGHLRSGWRLAIFCTAFLVCLQVTQFVLIHALSAALHFSGSQLSNSLWSVVSAHGAILISSL